MRAVVAWSEGAKGVEKGEQTPVYDLCFKPDGSQMVVAIGNRVLIYDAQDGDILHQLKGHKNTVYCVAYSSDGKRFASGGADKSVIIWTSKAEGILRYSHNDAVQCLAYNPITQQLASMTVSDFGLWSPEQKSVNKYKVSSKILSAGWTNDGQYLAIGHLNGEISIRDRNGKEIKCVQRSQPIWTMMWNPCREDKGDVLCVGCWDQTLSFYQLNGQQIGRDRDTGFDPCSVRYFGNGEYIVVGGSDRKASLWTKEGIRLSAIAERDAWVWAAVPRPKHNFVAVGSNDGDLTMYQLIFSTVHGLYQDRYAYRDHMTEVIIQHLITEQKARIKCKEYVKKIAVYKDRLAVQLPDRVVIYELTNDDPYDMLYRSRDKIHRKLECNLLVVTSQHVTLCQERKLQLYDLSGDKEREWVLEAVIRYIKVVGGPQGREGLLVGLKSGLVVKIFADNPFPIPLVRHKASVRCLDLSMSRNKLAVVDEHTNCVVYDLAGHSHGSPLERQPLWSEPNANSVSWNIEMEDMLCFSGNGTLSIKTANFPIHQQKLQGFVVGFKGSKIFCLHFMAMQTIDVPQSHSMLRYLEMKDYANAYKVACLGVTEADWRLLATEALGTLNFDVARKGFIRVRDMRYIELLNQIQSRQATTDSQIFLGEILAYQSRYQEAAKVFAKAGHVQKAIDMFSDLRKWEEAEEFAQNCDSIDVKDLMRRQAEWSIEMNDSAGAAKMWIAAGDFEKAIKILTELRDGPALHNLARNLTKMQVRELQSCAAAFTMMDQHEYAREVYVKLGDMKALIEVYVQLHRWDDAIALLPSHPEHKRDVYLPYAKWLLSHDRFEEAQEAFKLAGDPTLSLRMLEVLAHNAVIERSFSEASYYYWLLTKEHFKTIPEGTTSTQEGHDKMAMAEGMRERAMIYFAYERIYRYVEDPFTSLTGDTIFNTARFLLSTLSNSPDTPFNVSRVYILFAMAKQAKALQAFKLARFAYDKLQLLRTRHEWRDTLDVDALTLRSKPFSDKEDLLFMCFNCNTMNPLLNMLGDKCINCGHPIIRDIITFEPLPLVEFSVGQSMPCHEVKRMVGSNASSSSRQGEMGDGWSQSNDGGANVMRMDDGPSEQEQDAFADLLVNNPPNSEVFEPVMVDSRVLSTMRREEVYYMKPMHPDLPWRYFKSMLPEMPLTLCEDSQLFFREEDLEFYMLQHGQAPLTRSMNVAGFGQPPPPL